LKPAGGYRFLEIYLFGGPADSVSKYAEMHLEQPSGDLGSFTRDPIWAELSKQIATGTIALTATEWQSSGSWRMNL